jgi:hypothetical protein
LLNKELFGTGDCKIERIIELGALERTPLSGALDFDEQIGLCHHYVGIDLRSTVLRVREIESHLIVHDPYRDSGDKGCKWIVHTVLLCHPSTSIRRRNGAAGYCSRACATVSLKYITINVKRTLSELKTFERGTETSADESLYLSRSTTGTSPLSCRPFRRGTR